METPQRNDEISALDSIEHELYDPQKKSGGVVTHRTRDARTLDLPTSWGGEGVAAVKPFQDENHFSFGVKLLLFSAGLMVLALSFTAWRVLSSRNVVSSGNIDMTVDVAPSIEGGEATPLVVSLHNRNTSPLESATVTLMYERGVGAEDQQEKISEKHDIGAINANDYKRQDYQVTLYGSEAQSRDIAVKLEYKVAGSNATFSKITTTTVVLKTSPVSVQIDGPDMLSVGQNGTFTFSIKNNTATSSLPSLLQLTLPNTFTVESSSQPSSARGSIWTIPSLAAGETKSITLVGALSGTPGEKVTMKAQVGSLSGTATAIGVVYSAQTFDVALRTSPLKLDITLDTDRGTSGSLRYGDRTSLSLSYQNTDNAPLKDVQIVMSIDGDAALLKDIDPDEGYYDSIKRTITWNKAIVSELSSLAPGAQGNLRIVIPIVLKGTNSPSLKLSVTGTGTKLETNDVVASISRAWVVQGSANLSAATAYKNSPFVNTGPIPPAPNVDTTYAAHVVVSAQNALVNAKVSFILPVYSNWRGVVSAGAAVSYDQRTRTVTWNIGNLPAGRTTVVDIGLSVRPAQSHVGKTPAITSGIVLDADEEVSRAHIRTTISGLTTAISGESWSTDPSYVVDR